MSTKENVAKAYESGLFSQKEIAEKAGVSQSYVSTAIQAKKKEDYIQSLENQTKALEKELEYTKIDRNNIAIKLEVIGAMNGYNSQKSVPRLVEKDDIDID